MYIPKKNELTSCFIYYVKKKNVENKYQSMKSTCRDVRKNNIYIYCKCVIISFSSSLLF